MTEPGGHIPLPYNRVREHPRDTFFMPLLAPEFEQTTPASFAAHTRTLTRATVRKPERTRMPSPPKLKGRTKQTATKTRVGAYEVAYGPQAVTFAFRKPRLVSAQDIPQIVKILRCDNEIFLNFLKTKKFSIDSSMTA